MSSYSLRPTSFFGEHLDRELTLRGARTSGSTQRKQQRLQRFVEAEKPTTVETLRRTIVNIPSPEVRRSSRIARLLGDYLGY